MGTSLFNEKAARGRAAFFMAPATPTRVVTMATVGYGDISPGTAFGRFITSSLIIIGYSIIAVPTGIYTAELARSMRPKRRQARCGECGLPDHESDAWHCRQCGRALPAQDE